MHNIYEAFIQHGDSTSSMRTEGVDIIEKPMTHHILGLSYTATGYGNKLPTRFMVKFEGRWHRVYSVCYSNVSAEYIQTKHYGKLRVDLYEKPFRERVK